MSSKRPPSRKPKKKEKKQDGYASMNSPAPRRQKEAVHVQRQKRSTSRQPSSRVKNLYRSTAVMRRSTVIRNTHSIIPEESLDEEFEFDEDQSASDLYALRDVLGAVSNEDGFVDRLTFQTTFEVTGDEYEFSSTGKMDANALLVDACFETQLAEREQLRFIFNLFDTGDRGKINQKQVAKLLQASLARSSLDVVGMDFKNLSKLLYQKLHKDYTESINFTEFSSIFMEYLKDHNANKMDVKAEEDDSSLLEEWYERHGQIAAWLLLYMFLNVFAFLSKMYQYEVDPAVGWGLRIARGSAQAIMLNFLLVLLPMCRSIIGVLKHNNKLWRYIPFDENIQFHKLCGTVLLTLALVHAAAHISNILHLYAIATPEEVQASIFLTVPKFQNGMPPIYEFVTELPIWTGLILLSIVSISFPLAIIPKWRESKFHIFWYSHMLFGPFLVIACFHGATSWLATAQSYWWIIPPFLIYLIERRFRYAKMFASPINILKAEQMENTLGLFMERPKRFIYRPGMYLFLNVPALSAHEWHPFTISSAPGDEKHVSVHIRNAGDWTDALHKLIANRKANNENLPIVYIDGPVGAPTQDYRRFKTVMLIGGGIGVTPFASILRDTIYLWKEFRCQHCKFVQHPRNFNIQKMYFHWTTRAQDSFLWFETTMNQVAKLDTDNIIESHHYLTSVKMEDQNLPLKMFQAFVHDETGKDFVSGLKSKKMTTFGRPNWDTIFSKMKIDHPDEEIGVFFCGPHKLDGVLNKICQKYSSSSEKGTRFDYHSEKFG